MKSAPLESGILKLFRIFLVVQLVLIFVNVLAHSRRGMLIGCPWCAVTFGSVTILLLLGYLSWPWLQKKLGGFYLPIALAFAAVFSLVLQNFFLNIRFSSADGSSEETAWQLFLFLFIPLVLIAWQYNFKAVIAYCFLTAILDYTMMRYGRDDFYLIAGTYGRLSFIRAFSFLITGYVIASIMKQFREQRAVLQQANRQLTHYATTLEQLTVSRERNRMARELHDTLAHTLSGIAVQLEAVESLWKMDIDEARAMLGKSLVATRSGLAETRRALKALRASPLEDMGLGPALRRLAVSSTERAGLKLDWRVPDPLPKLSPDVEQCLYRVAQEAFENILRHAGASRALVDWTVEDGLLTLSIADDGCGFNPSGQMRDQHYGLRGMRERTQMVGGVFEVVSQPGLGTIIRLMVKV